MFLINPFSQMAQAHLPPLPMGEAKVRFASNNEKLFFTACHGIAHGQIDALIIETKKFIAPKPPSEREGDRDSGGRSLPCMKEK